MLFPLWVNVRCVFGGVLKAVALNPDGLPFRSLEGSVEGRGSLPGQALLCQTDLTPEVWPCQSGQSVTLLRRGHVVVHFERRSTFVWFCVASGSGWLDVHCVRFSRTVRWPNLAAVLSKTQ